MRLGTRWMLGRPAPAGLPAALLEAVADVERDHPAARAGGAVPSWTLTWLEGRPTAELDDGTAVTLDPATGAARIVPADADPDAAPDADPDAAPDADTGTAADEDD